MSDIQTFQASGTRDICASSAVRTRVLCVALSTCSFPLNQPEAEAEAAHDSGLAVERSGLFSWDVGRVTWGKVTGRVSSESPYVLWSALRLSVMFFVVLKDIYLSIYLARRCRLGCSQCQSVGPALLPRAIVFLPASHLSHLTDLILPSNPPCPFCSASLVHMQDQDIETCK